jgi:uncharacterized membrane protein
MKRIGVVAILILAFFGLADSAYLAQHIVGGTPLICNIQGLSGCNTVATSQYSYIFGIPLAELGVLFYGVLFILAALELVLFDQLLRRFLQAISLFGLIASLYYTYVQEFIIGAFCIYCLTSAIITLLVFVCASFIEPVSLRKKRDVTPMVPPPAPHLTMPPAP